MLTQTNRCKKKTDKWQYSHTPPEKIKKENKVTIRIQEQTNLNINEKKNTLIATTWWLTIEL